MTGILLEPRSIARRVFPSRLELKRFFGSSMEAPRAKVSFTTCLYDSPGQTIPAWDQTGVPGDAGFTHFQEFISPVRINLLRSVMNGGLRGEFPSWAGFRQRNMQLDPTFVAASPEE